MSDNILIVNEADNVAVALKSLEKGTELVIEGDKIILQEDISRGHKIALKDIDKGEKIIKYAFPIGIAREDIKAGNWIHTHNLKTALSGKGEYEYNPINKVDLSQESKFLKEDLPTFKGHKRDDGQLGIRNEIWLIPTVACINKPVEKMALLAEDKFKREIEAGKIDGIHAFTHPYGCSQLGGDLLNTQKILAGLVNHPNAAGVVVIGLGCENNLIEDFKEIIGDYNDKRVKFLNLQEIRDGIEEGLKEITSLVEYASAFDADDIPVSELKIGLKCGGSDAFSGITANPLLGRISDRLEAYGGTTILTEVPEMFGAESILMNRATDESVFNDIVKLINDFKDYFVSNNQAVY